MNETLHGIILDRNPYNEADALLHVLTKQHGVMTWIAKGAYKPKSKYGGILQPFVEIEAQVNVKKGISTFRSARVCSSHSHLLDNLHVLAMVSFLGKIIAINAQIDHQLIVYEQWKQYLNMINPSNHMAVGVHFLKEMARDLGMALYLDGCVVCQNPKVVGVSLSAGGFVCHQHLASNHYQLFDKMFLKQLRCLQKATIDQIEQCPSLTTLDHVQLYVSLLEDTLAIPMKNWHFIRQL